jgi:nitrogen fixation protein NifU and related proteins
MESMYQQIILDHYKHPQHHGLPEDFDAEVHHVNPTCGDEVTLRVRIADGQIAELGWEGEGCSISQASTSVLYDLAVGQDPDAAKKIVEEFRAMVRSRGTLEPDEAVLGDGVAFAGVGRHANRVKCAMLGWTAFEDALTMAEAVAKGGTNEETS